MPRITKMTLEELILGRQKRKGITDCRMAREIGLSPAGYSKRLKKGLTKTCSYDEVCALMRLVGIEREET